MGKVLVLSQAELSKLLTLDNVIPAVEQAFRALAGGGAANYPVVREFVAIPGVQKGEAIFGVKSGFVGGREERATRQGGEQATGDAAGEAGQEGEQSSHGAPPTAREQESSGILGLKAGGYWARNGSRGLPNHQSFIAVLEPDTGRLAALMDGNFITMIRTAAVGAIAARLFARPDSREATVIGAGTQGQAQALALAHVLPNLKVLTLYDKDSAAVDALDASFSPRLARNGIDVRHEHSVEAALASSDVVVTATPSFEPIVREVWIRPGMHISAFGADTSGKQELEAAILRRASLFVDDVAQCSTLGETQHALREGIIGQGDIRGTLGEVLQGVKVGRSSPEEVTVFDATGLSIQDLATAEVAIQAARRHGIGTTVEM